MAHIDSTTRATLVVFAGLPGSGKTTIARSVAASLGAVHVRIDTIEQSIRDTRLVDRDIGPAGYLIGYAIARDNLRIGLSVVADSVNPIAVTRNAWRAVAEAAGARLVEVEVVCSDPVEHRRRVESRESDVAGLTLPTWSEVVLRDYQSWDRACLAIDTAGCAVEDNVRRVLSHLAAE